MEIQGAPDVFFYPGSGPHIVARDPNDELLQFFHPGDRWHKANVTELASPNRVGPGLDAIEDILIAGDPHADWFLSYGSPGGVQHSVHIVARSREDKLLEFSWNKLDATWRVASLTDYAVIEEEDRAEVGYPLIAGNPTYYSLRLGSTFTQHVVARSRDGMQLLEWYWNTIDQTWRVVSLTGHRIMKVGNGVGDARIAGDPHGHAFTLRYQDTQHLVARSPDNRLLHWNWSSRDQTWRVESLTDRAVIADEDRDEVGNALIAGDPHGHEFLVFYREGNDQYTQHVVARSPDNQLLKWHWNSLDPTWRVASMSGHRTMKVGEGVGDARIAGNPHVHSLSVNEGPGLDTQYTQHVVARDPDNRLLHWNWSSRDQTWRVESLTDRAIKMGPGVGEALISDDPHGVDASGRDIVVARGLSPDSRLLEWQWNVAGHWNVRNDFPTDLG